MTSSQHGSYVLGDTHATMGGTAGDAKPRGGANPCKAGPQCRSGAATRPREVGVASNRGSAHRGEYVPGPCTHRPSRHESRQRLKSGGATARGQPPRAGPVIGTKS